MTLKQLIETIKNTKIDLKTRSLKEAEFSDMEKRFWALHYWVEHVEKSIPFFVFVSEVPTREARQFNTVEFNMKNHIQDLALIGSAVSTEYMKEFLWEKAIEETATEYDEVPGWSKNNVERIQELVRKINNYVEIIYGISIMGLEETIVARNKVPVSEFGSSRQAYDYLCALDDFKFYLWLISAHEALLRALEMQLNGESIMLIAVDATSDSITDDVVFEKVKNGFGFLNHFKLVPVKNTTKNVMLEDFLMEILRN